MDISRFKAIAFDADDTLWENETLFRTAEDRFCALMRPFLPEEDCQKALFSVEMKNLPLYGYGIKPFGLSLIEAAISLSQGRASNALIQDILAIVKDMLSAENPLLPNVFEVLTHLSQNYRLVVATKGDLLDQERKLERSGLAQFFHHIEVMSDKKPDNYRKLVRHLDLKPDEFLMVGNSVNSDVLPVLEIGAHSIHIPFHTTWAHEVGEEPLAHPNYKKLYSMRDLMVFFGGDPIL
jgi:putative hydrolase of the HAD superfamily